MKKFVLLLLCAQICFLGCNNEENKIDVVDGNYDMEGDFTISSEKAMKEAIQFIRSKTQSRSLDDEEIKVKTVWRSLKTSSSSSSVARTRSQVDLYEEIPVYIFSLLNEDDNAGYVVTIGDKRVLNRVVAFSDENKWDLSEIPDFEALFWNNVDEYIESTVSEYPGSMCDYYTTEVISETVKFCSDYQLQWGQSPSPYNDSVPACNASTNMVTGCVATAMGQIMAYNEYPLTGTYSHGQFNRTVNATYEWAKIKSNVNAELLSSSAGRSGIANILAEAGYKVYMNYGCYASGASNSSVQQAFNRMGYTCSAPVSYNYSTVRSEINKKRPVYISGFNNIGVGHAWVVEGIKDINTTYYWQRDCPYGLGDWDEDVFESTVEGTSSLLYLYFNLGWRGVSNGFYLAGISCDSHLTTKFSDWPFTSNIVIVHSIIPNK